MLDLWLHRAIENAVPVFKTCFQVGAARVAIYGTNSDIKPMPYLETLKKFGARQWKAAEELHANSSLSAQQ